MIRGRFWYFIVCDVLFPEDKIPVVVISLEEAEDESYGWDESRYWGRGAVKISWPRSVPTQLSQYTRRVRLQPAESDLNTNHYRYQIERERTDGACHVILLFVALNLNYISTCQVIPSYETLPHTQSWFCWTFRTNFVVCLTGLITGGKQFEMSHFVSGSKLSLDDKITLITLFSASFGIQ